MTNDELNKSVKGKIGRDVKVLRRATESSVRAAVSCGIEYIDVSICVCERKCGVEEARNVEI